MKLSDFFCFILAGFGLHQTSRITRKMPSGWEQLTCYAIGTEGTFPLFIVLLKRMRVPADIIVLASAAYQVAFLLVGLGVALGWLFDGMFKKER